MDIEGLGEAAIDQFVSAGLLSSYADIYRLHTHRKEILKLERWGEKSVDNLLTAISESTKRQFHRVLYALGIRHVGAGVARVLADHFGSIEALRRADEAALTAVYEIGEKIAASIVRFFTDPRNRDAVENLKRAGVTMSTEQKERRGPLVGKAYVLTGALSRYAREEAKRLIEERGGTVVSSVSSKTAALIAGEDPGSKLQKAQALGIPVIDENAFEALLAEKM